MRRSILCLSCRAFCALLAAMSFIGGIALLCIGAEKNTEGILKPVELKCVMEGKVGAENRKMRLDVSEGSGVGGYDLDIIYDPASVKVVSVKETHGSPESIAYNNQENEGTLRIAGVLSEALENAETVFVVTWKYLKSGDTSHVPELIVRELVDADGEPLPFETVYSDAKGKSIGMGRGMGRGIVVGPPDYGE
ncbi:MAG: cohesin domain-containing protein [Lachnospiraceae bacterium]|nr:cohesin domain-containing protein [Lachnospiraceae bacterium]